MRSCNTGSVTSSATPSRITTSSPLSVCATTFGFAARFRAFLVLFPPPQWRLSSTPRPPPPPPPPVAAPPVGFAARFRAFLVLFPPPKWRLSSTHSPHTGTECGLPSGLTVARQQVRATDRRPPPRPPRRV